MLRFGSRRSLSSWFQTVGPTTKSTTGVRYVQDPQKEKGKRTTHVGGLHEQAANAKVFTHKPTKYNELKQHSLKSQKIVCNSYPLFVLSCILRGTMGDFTKTDWNYFLDQTSVIELICKRFWSDAIVSVKEIQIITTIPLKRFKPRFSAVVEPQWIAAWTA